MPVQCCTAQRLTLFFMELPEVGKGQEIRVWMVVVAMRLVCCLVPVMGAFARVLHTQRADDDQCFCQATSLRCLKQNTRQTRIERQACHIATERKQFPALVHCLQFLQQTETIAYRARIGRLQKRKTLDVTKLQRQHLQND